MRVIDLRSDTVTLPTEGMIESVSQVQLGDDVYHEDPTVNKLEERAAQIFNMEAALLVTSGTQGNLLGLLAQTNGRGEEVIVERESHIYYYEVGGLAALGGVMLAPVPGQEGRLDPEDIRKTIRSSDIHEPQTRAIAVEQTHNRAGGTIQPLDNTQAIVELAREYGVGLHMDGARVFNAAVALGLGVDKLVDGFTTVQICLSKGLSAPVGSLLVGDQETIDKARKLRKMVGGGMRQAGIIAGPGIIALEEMPKRLDEDHRNASALAKGLVGIAPWTVKEPQTNIVKVTVPRPNANDIAKHIAGVGVRVSTMDTYTLRFVTHRMVSAADVTEVLGRLAGHTKKLTTLVAT